MKVGTKSLLVGAHQIFWHPFTVFLAWIELYGLPNWKEVICIFIHDWGYWGSSNMEGDEGQHHPYLGAKLALHYLDDKNDLISNHVYADLCLFHSRTLAARFEHPPSKLCWADKLCVKYDPWWLYLPRVWLSGEFHEYREVAAKAELFPMETPDREWYEWARERMIRKAYAQDSRPPYQEGS